VTELAELLRVTAGLPGLSVAAMRDGRVVYARGFGLRNLVAGVPVDSATQFNAASVSKVITATAALRLYERGLLDLDAPVRRFFPAFPDSTGGITPRRLAAHLSGLPHYGPGSTASTEHFDRAATALGVFAMAPRVGLPGQRYNYSTHGFTLLSAMMEVAASKSILELIANDVTGPLDMPSTGPDERERPTPLRTESYERVNGELRHLPQHREYSYSWAGAGLRTTPADLVRMTRAYLNGILPDSVVQVAFAEQFMRDGASTGVGFGWRVGQDWRGRRIAHHAGSNDGARSVVLMFRDERTSIAVMTNVQWVASIEETATMLHEALFHADHTPASLSVTGEYSGTFAGTPARGTWSIAGDTGSISVPAPFRALLDKERIGLARLPVRAIRSGIYAMVTPWGLYPLRLQRRDQQVLGDVSVAGRAWLLESK
jgi:serine beta-lactamase-like protein LACTB, mitochondrial